MAAEETAALSISLVALLLSFGYFMNCICNYPKRCTLFLLTFRTPYSILYLVCKTCASGSAVEHLLAKEGVAGSIPVSRLKKERYQIGIVLFFRALVWARKFDVYAPLRSAQSEVPRTSCAVSRLLRPAFPLSWCIRYKQKDDCTLLQPPSY